MPNDDGTKDPAAVSLGRRGGLAGKGAAKRRTKAFYKAQGRMRALKRWAKAKEKTKPTATT